MMVNQSRATLGCVALASLLLCLPVSAQNTFEELNGFFMLDLPQGWKLQPQQFPVLFQFKGDGTEIIIMYFEADATDRAALFGDAVDNFKNSMPNGAPLGEIVDITLNGNPARWAIYRGTTTYQNIEVGMIGYLGSVILENGGLYYFALVSELSKAEWEEPLTRSFHSIREVDTDNTGVAEKEAVAGGEVEPASSPASPPASSPATSPASSAVSSQPTSYEQKYVSLTLPPGWSAENMPKPLPDGTVAKLSSPSGGNMVIGCFNVLKKMFTPKKNNKALYKEAQGIIRTALPTATTLEGPYQIRNQDKKKLLVETYRGHMIVEGNEISMNAIQASGKTKRCGEGLTLYGFVGADQAGKALPEMVKIVQSIR